MDSQNYLDQIKDKSQNINVKEAASEVLNWLINNVEEYIDNKETIFSLYFPIDKIQLENLPNVLNLGSLYLTMDKEDIQDETKCMDFLNNITNLVKTEIINNKELLDKLFKKLIYYYEMISFSFQTGPVIREMDGYVTINKFFYEPIGLDVTVTKKYNRLTSDGTMETTDKEPEVVKQTRIPEGFVIELEIKSWPKQNVGSVL